MAHHFRTLRSRILGKVGRALHLNNHHLPPIPQSKICFIHIPKCAGTSFSHAILEHYGWSPRSHGLDAVAASRAADVLGKDHLNYRRELILYLMASLERERFGFLTGHFAFSQVAYERFGRDGRSSPSWRSRETLDLRLLLQSLQAEQ